MKKVLFSLLVLTAVSTSVFGDVTTTSTEKFKTTKELSDGELKERIKFYANLLAKAPNKNDEKITEKMRSICDELAEVINEQPTRTTKKSTASKKVKQTSSKKSVGRGQAGSL